MQFNEFRQFYSNFQEADIDKKIDLYCHTTDLTEEQYMQLLRTFPPSGIKKLEEAIK